MATKSIRLGDGTDTFLPESAVSTSFATGNSGTGYSKMADGTLICWGTLQNVTAARTEITYPVSFSAYPTVVASTGAGNIRTPIYVETVDRAKFSIYRYDGGSTSGIWLRWIAIGRWK